MSGGQRKRVTFADLVTARLPSPAPQQTPGSRPADLVVDPQTISPTTAAEQPGAPTVIPETLHNVGDSNNLETAPTTGELHPTPVLKQVSVAPQEPGRPSPHDSLPANDRQPPHDSLPSDDRQSRDEWQSSDDSQPPAVRRTFRQAGGGQTDSQPSRDSRSSDDSQPSNDRQPLKEVKGYLKLANTIVDSLMPTLDVYEQAVFIQLYRLAHGFGNFTCKVSLPALQARTGVKPTSLKQAIARLQVRGIVEKISAEIGFGREQGITYWVSSDGRQTYSDWQSQGGSQPLGDDNKRKENSKETKIKGKLTPEQIKDCPDCRGVGMWYPEGPGKGVARCYHPSLKV